MCMAYNDYSTDGNGNYGIYSIYGVYYLIFFHYL